MNYLSIEFGVLFILFFVIYWLCQTRPKLQNLLLLISSYLIVCSYSWQFAVILFVYTCVIYLFAILIFNSKHNAVRWLVLSFCAIVINLAIFKYFDFFRTELQALINLCDLPLLLPVITILIPIGISFYTFHSVSYLVSIYKKELPLAKFWDFALFLSFFPSIIAGPINRAKDFLPQITLSQSRKILEPERAFTLIILAIFKVYCLGGFINDNWVNPIFANPLEFSSLDLLLGLYSYAVQIYLNFSGYTDLVTGIALLLGFRLPINFNIPYLALNLREFWMRWHISLSSWIRDYIYIPLGGSRHGFVRTQINVMIAMLLSGLWHGVGVNFILWGACHGIGIVVLNLSDKYLGKGLISQRSPFIARILTLHYVCLTWLFFHCDNINDIVDYLTALTDNIFIDNHYIIQLVILIVIYCLYPWLKMVPEQFTTLISKISYLCWPFIFVAILWGVIYFAPSGVPNFIYAGF